MKNLFEKFSTIDGIATRILIGTGTGPTVVLLHGGTPGHSPFCGGTHLWGGFLDRFAAARRLVVPDLPGSGRTPAVTPLTVESMTAHVIALIRLCASEPVHVVGHDLGGLVALRVAIDAPELLASLTVAASAAAAPTGDSVENVTLLHPPLPLWSRQSQAWAYDRLSYSHHHIDDRLLDASVAAARDSGLELARKGPPAPVSNLTISASRVRLQFLAVARDKGIAVPTQIIWAQNDPLIGVDRGFWLYRVIAAKQPVAHFHVINRSGSFPFREQPDEFLRVLAAFQDGVIAESI